MTCETKPRFALMRHPTPCGWPQRKSIRKCDTRRVAFAFFGATYLRSGIGAVDRRATAPIYNGNASLCRFRVALVKFQTLRFCVRGPVSPAKSNVATLRKSLPGSRLLPRRFDQLWVLTRGNRLHLRSRASAPSTGSLVFTRSKWRD